MIFNQRALFTGIIFVLFCFFYSPNLLASEGSERIGIGEAGFLEEGQRPPYFEMRKYPFLSRGFFKSIDSDSYFKANLIGKESIIMIFPEKTGTNMDLSLGQFSVQYAKGTFSEMKLKKALMESEVIDRYFFSIAQTPKTFRANQAGARAYSFSGTELDFKIKSKQKAKYFVEVQDKSGPEFSILLREFFFKKGTAIEMYPLWVGSDERPSFKSISMKLYPSSALNALGYDSSKDFSSQFKVDYKKGRLTLKPVADFKAQILKNGIWVSIFTFEIEKDSKIIRRQIQVRFSMDQWNVDLLSDRKFEQDGKNLKVLLSINSPIRGNFRVSANILTNKGEPLAFSWQEVLLSEGINNISLPVPFKYLTKKAAVTGSGADLIKSLKIADIEIYSRALEPFSTYRYYEE